MDPRLLEHFREITNILKNREEPVDVFLISEKFKISIKQAKLLLNNFISQKNLLAEYNLIFSAEIISENKLKTVLVPSFSPKLKEIMALKDNLIHLGVFAVYKKEQVNLLKDYSVFVHENRKFLQTEIIEISQQQNANTGNSSNLAKNNVNNTSNNNITSINSISAQANKNASSSSSATPTTSLNFGKNGKNTTNTNNLKTSSANNSTNKSVSSNNQNNANGLAKAFEGKVSINKNDVAAIQGTIVNSNSNSNTNKDSKDNFKNQAKVINATITEVNADGDDNDGFGEENYYGGATNNKAANNNSNNVNNSIPVNASTANSFATGKRKYNEMTSEESATAESKKIKRDAINKPNGIAFSNKSVISDSSDDEVSNNSSKVKYNTGSYNGDNHTNNMESSVAGKASAGDVPKKIRKIRKVKKTNTYIDEKGYMRTVDEFEDEEYWTDEKPKPLPMNHNGFFGNNSNNQGGKKPVKKVAQGQSNLLNFFGGK